MQVQIGFSLNFTLIADDQELDQGLMFMLYCYDEPKRSSLGWCQERHGETKSQVTIDGKEEDPTQ